MTSKVRKLILEISVFGLFFIKNLCCTVLTHVKYLNKIVMNVITTKEICAFFSVKPALY